ncbi:MAG: hypothetical protein P4L84_07320 [Isosphaeraceae bacterium]|nr:hypothetical protein [Isosphaeraceae bacterium]
MTHPTHVFRIPLRVVFYQEGSDWVAHCLEFDLMGDGPDKAIALERLYQAIGLQVEATYRHKNEANLFSPADGRIFAMFAAGKDVGIGKIEITASPIVVEGVSTREYSDGLAIA